MQRALNCVQNWFGKTGLNVNSDKTSDIYGTFHKKEEFGGFFRPKTLWHGTDTEQSGKISGKWYTGNAVGGNRKTWGGVLDIHFDNKTNVDICHISLVERRNLTTVKKQFGHIQRTTCFGLTPLQLVVEKEARQTAYRLHWSNLLKNETGDFLLFSR
jgi:hypothetical protein